MKSGDPGSAFPRGSHLWELRQLSLLERACTVLFAKIPAGPSLHLYMNYLTPEAFWVCNLAPIWSYLGPSSVQNKHPKWSGVKRILYASIPPSLALCSLLTKGWCLNALPWYKNIKSCPLSSIALEKASPRLPLKYYSLNAPCYLMPPYLQQAILSARMSFSTFSDLKTPIHLVKPSWDGKT